MKNKPSGQGTILASALTALAAYLCLASAFADTVSITPVSGGTGSIMGASYGACPTGADYLAANNASPGNQLNSTGSVGQSAYIDFCGQAGFYNVFRYFMSFNTGQLLPDSAVITSATLHFTFGGVTTEDADFVIQLVQSGQASPTGLSVNDFNRLGSLSGGLSVFASSMVANQSNAISLNPTGLSWINTTGWTQLGLRSSRDLGMNAPTDSNGNNWPSEFGLLINGISLEVTYTTVCRSRCGVHLGTSALSQARSIARRYETPV